MMTATERLEWLETRKTGIGGSEIGSLLSNLIPEVKYGCRRSLWYSKSKIERDFEQEETAAMHLGTLMEGPICDLYANLTGRRIEEVGRMVHPKHPEMGVSLDRLVYTAERPRPGIIEAKCPGSRNFYSAKRESLPIDYLLQGNHGMLIASAALGIEIDWAVMVVGKSDDPRLIARCLDWHMKVKPTNEINPSYILYWEIEKNQDICDAILREGPAFWQTIGQPDLIPERLAESEDPRCGRCSWRQTCRGAVASGVSDQKDIPVVADLAPFAMEYIERRKLLDEAEELVAETKEILMVMLGDKQAVHVPVNGVNRPIYWRPQDGKPLYGDAVKNMSVQYTQMRDTLIQIQTAITDPNARDVDGTLQSLVAGAELIPVPATFIRKGKPSRPLMLQYLAPKPKGQSCE